MSQQSQLRNFILIAALVLIWGVSWPVYKLALSYTPPILFAGMRTFIGGLALALVSLPKWKEIALRRNMRIYLVSAFLNVFLFFGLQTVGLSYMPGGLFSVIVYIQPVLVGFIAYLWLGESLSLVKMIGLLLGFLGVTVISTEGVFAHLSVSGLILALLTAIAWAFGVFFLKKDGHAVNPLWLVALQFLIGGLALTALGLGVESWSDIVWNASYVSSLAFGCILGVPTAWIIYFVLIRSGDASKVAAITFLVPLISVLGSTLFLHEPLRIVFLAGLFLIVTSIYLVNRKSKRLDRGHSLSSS